MFLKICRERLNTIETAAEICIIKTEDINEGCVRRSSVYLYNTGLNTIGWIP